MRQSFNRGSERQKRRPEKLKLQIIRGISVVTFAIRSAGNPDQKLEPKHIITDGPGPSGPGPITITAGEKRLKFGARGYMLPAYHVHARL
eukprot:753953-Hanusia_phi.AAC.8